MVATGKTDATIFIFGDSTVDVGTNNHLPRCTTKADHRYHGIDFGYSKSTGRFSNGQNAADQIGI
ncbi:Lipase, GDSL [Artemisia annua]|uniref:Lipase, GDSL n=1 Tax=Artemisia annua TaxID=35608 RepID=A0A2U1LBS3_ARTAN|nr:Lipase, GDSL [Artemisia annua]